MSEEDTTTVAPKKRAPRKQVPRSVSKTAERPARTAPARRRTTTTTRSSRSKIASPDLSEASRPARKSPTPLSENATLVRQRKRQRIILASIVLVGVVASAGVGFTDEGTVDIEARIEARNERIRNNTPTEQDLMGGVEPVTATAANSARPVEADGGMTGRGTGGRTKPSATAPEVKTATTTVDVVSDQGTTTASTTSGTNATTSIISDTETPESLLEDISDTDNQPEESVE